MQGRIHYERGRTMKRNTIREVLVTALFPVLIAGCTTNGIAASALPPKTEQSAATQSPSTQSPALPDFSGIAAQAGPAVVNISVTKNVTNVAQSLPFDENDPFFQFFKRFQIPMPQQTPSQGIGSGFIISPNG